MDEAFSIPPNPPGFRLVIPDDIPMLGGHAFESTGGTMPAAFRFWDQPAPPWTADTRAAAMLAYALAYADFGWPVFPCCAPDIDDPTRCHHGVGCGEIGKRPLTPNGWKNATTDPATIRGWWRRYRGANIALSCAEAGVFVIDGDAPKPVKDENGAPLIDDAGQPVMTADGVKVAYAFYDGLIDEASGDTVTSSSMYTAVAYTPRSGQHWYWRLPPEVVAGGWRVRNATNALASVDVRGTGGYVMLPPSWHVAGRHYYWRDGWIAPPPPGEYMPGRVHGIEGIAVAPRPLVRALRDLGLLVNPGRDRQQEHDPQASVRAVNPVPISGARIDAALNEIVAEVLPLAEGTPWQAWQPVNRDDPRGPWHWQDYAGRNEFMYRQVACRAWRALAPVAKINAEHAPKFLAQTLARANKRLVDQLDPDDLARIAASARKNTTTTIHAPRDTTFPRIAPRLSPTVAGPGPASTDPTPRPSSSSPRRPKQDKTIKDKNRGRGRR